MASSPNFPSPFERGQSPDYEEYYKEYFDMQGANVWKTWEANLPEEYRYHQENNLQDGLNPHLNGSNFPEEKGLQGQNVDGAMLTPSEEPSKGSPDEGGAENVEQQMNPPQEAVSLEGVEDLDEFTIEALEETLAMAEEFAQNVEQDANPPFEMTMDVDVDDKTIEASEEPFLMGSLDHENPAKEVYPVFNDLTTNALEDAALQLGGAAADEGFLTVKDERETNPPEGAVVEEVDAGDQLETLPSDQAPDKAATEGPHDEGFAEKLIELLENDPPKETTVEANAACTESLPPEEVAAPPPSRGKKHGRGRPRTACTQSLTPEEVNAADPSPSRGKKRGRGRPRTGTRPQQAEAESSRTKRRRTTLELPPGWTKVESFRRKGIKTEGQKDTHYIEDATQISCRSIPHVYRVLARRAAKAAANKNSKRASPRKRSERASTSRADPNENSRRSSSTKRSERASTSTADSGDNADSSS